MKLRQVAYLARRPVEVGVGRDIVHGRLCEKPPLYGVDAIGVSQSSLDIATLVCALVVALNPCCDLSQLGMVLHLFKVISRLTYIACLIFLSRIKIRSLERIPTKSNRDTL